jgi:pilus assembly protein CpaC
MRIRAALLTIAALACAKAADPPASHPISLVEGAGQLLQFERDIDRLAIAEPKIADAVLVSARDVMVDAKGPGQTTLVVWETGAAPVLYNIRVVKDTWEQDRMDNSLGASLRAAAPNAGIEFTGNAESIVLTGRVANADESKRAEALAALHTKKVVNMLQVSDPRQILLEVKFADVDRVMLSQFGFNLVSRNGTTLGETSTQQFAGPLFPQIQSNPSGTPLNISNLLNLFIFRPDINLGATIQALQQQNIAQILAEPNLIVEEGQDASFLAGGQFPFPTITATPTGGGISPVVTVQFKKFGVQLDFTPTITASGAIHLKVRPEVSALDYTNAVTLEGFLIPAISSRVAETSIILKDGESFAIAGLIDNRVTQVLNKIMILGDLPILGQLFRSHSTQKSTDELLVVVTPHFVKPVPPGEELRLPTTVVPYLLPVAPKKGKDKSPVPDSAKPEFVGPQGYVLPKQQQQ